MAKFSAAALDFNFGANKKPKRSRKRRSGKGGKPGWGAYVGGGKK